MDVRLLRPTELSARDVAAWQALAADAADPNPFFEPDLVLPAARHLGGDPRLVVVRDGASWRACLPVVRRLRPAPHLAAWTHDFGFSGTPLLDAAHVERAAAALTGWLARRRTMPFTRLEQLDGDGRAARSVGHAFCAAGLTPLSDHVEERAALLPRIPGAERPALLSAKRRSELRRKARRLGEAAGGDVAVVEAGGSDAALTRFLELEHAGWKGAEGTSLLACAQRSAFFSAMATGFAEQGRLVLLELHAGSRVVASTTALRSGDGVFGFKVGHDPAFEAFSPGVQLQVALGERVLDEGPQVWLDSCSDPGNDLQNRLWPDRRTLRTLVVPTRSPLADLARRVRVPQYETQLQVAGLLTVIHG